MALATDINDPMEQFWAAADPPQGITPAMWIAIKSIKDDTSKTTNRVNNIECQVKTNRDDIAELRDEITLLKAQAKRHAAVRSQMSNHLEDLQSRSMRNNIKIFFDPTVSEYREAKGEKLCVPH